MEVLFLYIFYTEIAVLCRFSWRMRGLELYKSLAYISETFKMLGHNEKWYLLKCWQFLQAL